MRAILQVNMGTKLEPIWNTLGREYALKTAKKAIGGWNQYHRYTNRQFRIVEHGKVIFQSNYAEA